MAEQNEERKPEGAEPLALIEEAPDGAASVTATYARDFLGEIMRQAAFAGRRYVITEHGTPRVGIVSMKDLDRLRQLDAADRSAGKTVEAAA